MKTIIIRTLSGAVFITLVLGSLIYNTSVFAMVLLLLNLIALNEFQQFNKNNELPLLTNLLGIGSFILSHFAFLNVIELKWLWLLALVPFIIFTVSLFSEKIKLPFLSIGFSILGLVYISFPLILLNLLNIQIKQPISWIIVSMLIIIWTNDTFAFLSGLAFGKHKLFERISPKKTWEGFIGGLIVALITGFFLYRLLDNIELIQWLILTLLIVISSVCGDFIESLFKRTAGIKDSGKIMPGHGGILDRIDSLLFVVPIMYIYLQIIN